MNILNQVLNYTKSNEISLLQSVIKHSIIPKNYLSNLIPLNAYILDIGCGEGILDNLIAKIRKDVTLLGCDLNNSKVKIANENSPGNSNFICEDFFDLSLDKRPDIVIVNDMLHHLDFKYQLQFLDKVNQILNDDGGLILKEVDILDKFDFNMTKYFDSKIYPEDNLSFRSLDDWKILLIRSGFNISEVKKVFHPWPASRTIITAKKSNNCNNIFKAKKIKKENLEWKLKNPNGLICLVTGATGFIGAHLVNSLKNGLNGNKVKIIILSRKLINTEHDLLNGDLDDIPYLSEALIGVDYVYHLAAEVKFFSGIDIERNNTLGTKTLIDVLNKVNVKKIIYTSTIGVHDRKKWDKCEKLLDEDSSFSPTSLYGKTKLEGEYIIKNSGIDYVILRLPWVFGSGMTPDTHIRKLFEMVINNKIITRFNFPGRVSVISVHDLIKALLFVTGNKSLSNEIFLVCNDNPISIGDIFKSMSKVLNKNIKRFKIPLILRYFLFLIRGWMPLSVNNLTLDILAASNNKIKKLGFKTDNNMQKGLNELYEYIIR